MTSSPSKYGATNSKRSSMLVVFPGRALQRLTKEMIDSARVNALLSEADTVIGLLIVLLQPRGLPPPPMVAFTPQASPPGNGHNITVLHVPTCNPRDSCGERRSPLLRRPKSRKTRWVIFVHGRHLQLFPVSADDRSAVVGSVRRRTRAHQVDEWSRLY